MSCGSRDMGEWWWGGGGMVVTITPSQAPTASSAVCPGQKMLLAEFPFLCTLSPSLPMAASQGASTAGLALPYQHSLCVIAKKILCCWDLSSLEISLQTL